MLCAQWAGRGWHSGTQRIILLSTKTSIRVDYTEELLPVNRKQLFWETVRFQGWPLFRLGFILLLFALPLHIIALLEDILIAQLYAAEPELSDALITAYSLELENLRTLLTIPLLLVFSIGFSGASHTIRQYAWGENVVFGYDFAKGIRQNGRQMAMLALLVGCVNYICVACSNLSFTTTDSLAANMVYLPAAIALFIGIPLSAYMTVCIPVYCNTFLQNIRLSAVLLLHAT